MKTKLAKIISTFGHPMLTIPLFVSVVLFSNNDAKSALFLTLLIVGFIFVPSLCWMYLKSKNGSYTNFDVSDKKQRRSLFIFIIPFLIIVNIVLILTHQSETICRSVLFATILTFVSQIVNYFIKSSMHVSLTLFLAFLAFALSLTITGFLFVILSIIIGWSRVVLKRHSVLEVFVGAAIGLTIGTIMFYFERLKY